MYNTWHSIQREFTSLTVCVHMQIIFLYHQAPEEAPSITDVTVESSRSIVVSWRSPRVMLLHGELVLYYITVEETQIFHMANGTIISQEGINRNRTSNAREDTEVVIGMLHPNYNYTVRIAAQTTVGMGPFSESFSVTTMEDGETCFVHVKFKI